MKEICSRRNKKLVLGAIAVLVGVALPIAHVWGVPSAVEAQAPHRKVIVPKAAPNSAKELQMPFRAGETLTYRVSWATFSNAASVEVSIPEKRDLFGWATWHFRASIHTVSPVRSLFTVDDEFDSYTDRATLESRQYEMYLNELGRKQEQVLHLVALGQKPRIPGAAVSVLPGTRDPLGALYSLRSVDWQRTPELRAPIYDGRDVYNMTAKIEASSDPVAVPAGNFSASRISIRLIQGAKEVPIAFTIWLANNAVRTPVQIQAELPFGSVRAGLTSSSQ
jgi:hypothetical protein